MAYLASESTSQPKHPRLGVCVLAAVVLALLAPQAAEAYPAAAGDRTASAGVTGTGSVLDRGTLGQFVARRRKKRRRRPRATRRSRRRGTKAVARPPVPVRTPPAATPSATATAGGAAPAGGDASLRRGARVEFDGRLVQGQTAKSGAIYLFARKRSELRSMVEERSSYRQEIIGTVYANSDKTR